MTEFFQHVFEVVFGEKLGDDGSAPGSRTRAFGVISGLLLLASGIFHTYMYIKFTPVYTATECGGQEATLDDFRLGASSISVRVMINVMCTNPNPYRIQILSSEPGRVFIGRGLGALEVGNLTVIPGSFLEAEGDGNVRVRMLADVSGPEANSLVPHFLQDAAVPITMHLQFSVGISISFGLGTWGTQAPFHKDCGLNMKGIFVTNFMSQTPASNSRLGPLVCRDSFKGMHIPMVGDPAQTPEDGGMGFSAAQVAPAEVWKGELIKNVSLGTMIALSFFLAAAVPIYFWFFGPRCPKRLLLLCSTKSRHPCQDEQSQALVGGGLDDLENEDVSFAVEDGVLDLCDVRVKRADSATLALGPSPELERQELRPPWRRHPGRDGRRPEEGAAAARGVLDEASVRSGGRSPRAPGSPAQSRQAASQEGRRRAEHRGMEDGRRAARSSSPRSSSPRYNGEGSRSPEGGRAETAGLPHVPSARARPMLEGTLDQDVGPSSGGLQGASQPFPRDKPGSRGQSPRSPDRRTRQSSPEYRSQSPSGL